MVIYISLLKARFEVGEFYGAQVAGQIAAKIARELEAWDYFGTATMWLGASLDRLRQPKNAIATWYEYLAHVPYYSEAAREQALAHYNIGLASARSGHLEEGIRMLQKAADVAVSMKNYRYAHGIRHALIDTFLRHNMLDRVPRLLAQCGTFLRKNPNAEKQPQSLLWHMVLRTRYAVATHRPRRALQVARRGLCLCENVPGMPDVQDMEYHFRYLSAQSFELIGDRRSAISEGVRARAVATAIRRYDLEYEATDYLYGLLRLYPELLQDTGDQGSQDMEQPGG